MVQIRADDHDMEVSATPNPSRLQPAVMIVAMIQLHLNVSRRKGGNVKVAYPDGTTLKTSASGKSVKHTCFRGGGMPTEHLRFFEVRSRPCPRRSVPCSSP